MKRLGVVIILVLAFFGLADSLYLAQHAISGTPLLCNIENLNGCNIVADSPYSRLFGVPLAEYGVLFYSILFVLAALELVLFDRLLRRALQGMALISILASTYFVMLQVFFIGAFCIYCAASAFISFLIFIFATRIEPLRRRVAAAPSNLPTHETSSPEHGLPMPPSA